jgi:predicted dienelactone hydrolase
MRRWMLVIAFAVGCGNHPVHSPEDAASHFDAAAVDDLALAPTDGSTSDLGSASNNYDSDGSDSVTTFTATVTNGARNFTEHIYLPGSAGLHPVVVLSPGLQQTAAAYQPYGQRLASWGIVMLVRDDPGALTVTPDVTADLTYVVGTWLVMQNVDASSMLVGKIDLARVGLAGHSRGGQASLIAAEMGLKGKVKAWFGLDPVDSTNLSSGTQARTTLATIGIPTTFLGASVASNCSPVADDYAVLYAAAPSPAVQLVGVGAGHTQFEDPGACTACNLCSPSGTANGQVVLAYAVRYSTAFFARELSGDASVGATFAGAGVAVDVTAGKIQLSSK